MRGPGRVVVKPLSVGPITTYKQRNIEAIELRQQAFHFQQEFHMLVSCSSGAARTFVFWTNAFSCVRIVTRIGHVIKTASKSSELGYQDLLWLQRACLLYGTICNTL